MVVRQVSLQNILYNYRFHSVSISVFTLMESKSDHWIPRNRSPRNRFHVIWTAAHHQRSNHLCFHGTANHGCACRTQLAYPMIVFFALANNSCTSGKFGNLEPPLVWSMWVYTYIHIYIWDNLKIDTVIMNLILNPLKLHIMGGNYIGQCSKTLRPPLCVSTFSQLMDYHDKPQYIG